MKYLLLNNIKKNIVNIFFLFLNFTEIYEKNSWRKMIDVRI